MTNKQIVAVFEFEQEVLQFVGTEVDIETELVMVVEEGPVVVTVENVRDQIEFEED